MADAGPRYVLGSDPALGLELPTTRPRSIALATRVEDPSGRGGSWPGCACLDLGTGPGHVALMLAEMVGPSGVVVGVDQAVLRSPGVARGAGPTSMASRTSASGRGRCDPHGATTEPFDAVVERLLLFHARRLRSPSSAITRPACIRMASCVCNRLRHRRRPHAPARASRSQPGPRAGSWTPSWLRGGRSDDRRLAGPDPGCRGPARHRHVRRRRLPGAG